MYGVGTYGKVGNEIKKLGGFPSALLLSVG